jgi:hypothetical protein
MSREGLHPDVTHRDESFSRGIGRVCVITIWGVVILGYILCYVIERYYGYAMYYGMIVFLIPAILVTILFLLGRTIGWLMSHRSKSSVIGQ